MVAFLIPYSFSFVFTSVQAKTRNLSVVQRININLYQITYGFYLCISPSLSGANWQLHKDSDISQTLITTFSSGYQ